jgi:hypothetical protein
MWTGQLFKRYIEKGGLEDNAPCVPAFFYKYLGCLQVPSWNNRTRIHELRPMS